MYQPEKITTQSIRDNETAPSVLPVSHVFNASIKPNVYFFILESYHDYIYLATHYLNYMLKAQFRQIFGLTDASSRHRFKKLLKDEDITYRDQQEKRRNKEYSVLGKAEYKGSHCIFPLSRAFNYSEINFPNKKKKRLEYEPKEATILMGIMHTEYWLRYGELIVDDLNFLPDYLAEELLRPHPFDYHSKAFFWMITELKTSYASFSNQSENSELIIDKEVPKHDIEALDSKEKEKNKESDSSGLLEFGLSPDEKKKLEDENEFDFRFSVASPEAKKQYVSEINKAAFKTLLKSNVYITKVIELEQQNNLDPKFEYKVAIFHFPNNNSGRYNSIITALQTITCYQNISVKLNITVVGHSEKTTNEAYYAWEQAVKRRDERTDKVNLENRARKDLKRIKKGAKVQGITEKDIKKYCKTSNKFCRLNEVNFVNLNLEKYFTNHVGIEDDFDPGDLQNED